MEAAKLTVFFDEAGQKILSTEGVVACNETFSIVFSGVTLTGKASVGFWADGGDTLLWRTEGTPTPLVDGEGCELTGLVASTQELVEYFGGGATFRAAALTVGETDADGTWHDYGVARMRLYVGTNPMENPAPARPDVYPTEEELDAWLAEAKTVQGAMEDLAEGAASSANAAAASAQTAAEWGDKAVASAQGAAKSEGAAKAAQEAAEAAQKAAQGSAQAAQGSATIATKKAQEAAGSATTAQGARDEALSAKTASVSAQGAAEAAKVAAVTAQGAAESARDAAFKAQRSAEGAARAAASAASAAGQSASDAATSAGTASSKAGEAATSASNAASAASAAASSATAASGSATDAASAKDDAVAAKTSAEKIAASLEDELQEVQGLEGRVAKLEGGKGVYVDEEGNVEIYTPLPESDGTLKVVKELPNLKKIEPLGNPSGETPQACTDGRYNFIYSGGYYWSSMRVWVYDHKWHLQKFFPVYKFNAWGPSLYNDTLNASGLLTVVGEVGEDGTDNRKLVYVWKSAPRKLSLVPFSGDGATPEKTVTLHGNTCYVARNPQTENLIELYTATENGVTRLKTAVWGADLEPVLGDDGEQKGEDLNDLLGLSGNASTPLHVRQIYGWVYMAPCSQACYLLRATADDTWERMRESIIQEDPDNPGKVLYELDAEGNRVEDDPSQSNPFWRLVTEPGDEIRYNDTLDGFASNVRTCFPAPMLKNSNVSLGGCALYVTDGLRTWFVGKDGRWINQVNTNYMANNTVIDGAAAYYAGKVTSSKYDYPLPTSPEYILPCGWGRTDGVSGCLIYTPTRPNSPLSNFVSSLMWGRFGPTANTNTVSIVIECQIALSSSTTTTYACAIPDDHDDSSVAGCAFGSPIWFATKDACIKGIL